ncbi:Bug family tripartite tricarboxylate transporter substrate binding protein [Achromobacter aloeverae]|uniref:Tripartite tricarboxylate transporter substrate binding protein n=1 Tax=Achromobacter aloeverae TaxID=1750518 RepID=A0A4Q1HM45_9BURK|nr:tripartite tricarboxylate transporter substrate binding protein [Achromobacter aloeverae]RXN91573.1 tripartite tricarboxylate transporter substrate binding protein [Achromobacter aloeverae]
MKTLVRVAALAALSCAAASAHADAYPDRPIRLVVGFSAGGGSDLVARTLAKPLGEQLHQSVVVENRPGAGGMLATRGVAKEKPDGYTLLLGSAAAFVINPYIQKDVGYDAVKDFTPIGAVSRFEYVLMGRKGLPAHDVKSLTEYAGQRPNELTIGNAGIGSNTHLVAIQFLAETGLKIRNVPYKGTAGALNDIMGGNIDLLFDSVPTVTQQVKSGAVQGYATTGDKREHDLPDVPTLMESGLPHFQASNWFAIFGPRDMDPAVVNRLNAAIVAALHDPALVKAFEATGNEPLAGSPQDLTRLVADETARYKTLIEKAHITAE